MQKKIDNILSCFDFLEGESSLFWLLFGFMFIVIVEELTTMGGFSKGLVLTLVSLSIIVRVLRIVFYPKNEPKLSKSTKLARRKKK